MGMEIEQRIKALEAQLDAVDGRTHALKAVLGAFMIVSPSRLDLLAGFDAIEDVVESTSVPTGVSEAFLHGAREMLEQMRLALNSPQEL